MAKYLVTVIEIQAHSREYVVDARTKDQAYEKAANGDTEQEYDLKFEGVEERHVCDLSKMPSKKKESRDARK